MSSHINSNTVEFRLQQIQIQSPFKLVFLISFVNNNRNPPITITRPTPISRVRDLQGKNDLEQL